MWPSQCSRAPAGLPPSPDSLRNVYPRTPDVQGWSPERRLNGQKLRAAQLCVQRRCKLENTEVQRCVGEFKHADVCKKTGLVFYNAVCIFQRPGSRWSVVFIWSLWYVMQYVAQMLKISSRTWTKPFLTVWAFLLFFFSLSFFSSAHDLLVCCAKSTIQTA